MRSPTARTKRFLEAQLTARLDEQASQIQKVTAQFEASKPAPQVVNNNQYSCADSNKAGAFQQSAVTLHRVAAFCLPRSRFPEIARVLVRFDDFARFTLRVHNEAVSVVAVRVSNPARSPFAINR